MSLFEIEQLSRHFYRFASIRENMAKRILFSLLQHLVPDNQRSLIYLTKGIVDYQALKELIPGAKELIKYGAEACYEELLYTKSVKGKMKAGKFSSLIKNHDYSQAFPIAVELFDTPHEWPGQLYGGQKWSKISQALLNIHLSLESYQAIPAAQDEDRIEILKQMMLDINRLEQMVHNTGGVMSAIVEKELSYEDNVKNYQQYQQDVERLTDVKELESYNDILGEMLPFLTHNKKKQQSGLSDWIGKAYQKNISYDRNKVDQEISFIKKKKNIINAVQVVNDLKKTILNWLDQIETAREENTLEFTFKYQIEEQISPDKLQDFLNSLETVSSYVAGLRTAEEYQELHRNLTRGVNFGFNNVIQAEKLLHSMLHMTVRLNDILNQIKPDMLISQGSVRGNLAKRIFFSLLQHLVPENEKAILHLTEGVVDYQAMKQIIPGAKEMIRYGTAACVKETYHWDDSTVTEQIEILYQSGNIEKTLRALIDLFSKKWRLGFGGTAWKQIAETLLQIHLQLEGFQHSKDEKTKINHLKQITISINVLDGLAHNFGSILDKIIQEEKKEFSSSNQEVDRLMNAKQLKDPNEVLQEILPILERETDAPLTMKDWMSRARQQIKYTDPADRERKMEKIKVKKKLSQQLDQDNLWTLRGLLSNLVVLPDNQIETKIKLYNKPLANLRLIAYNFIKTLPEEKDKISSLFPAVEKLIYSSDDLSFYDRRKAIGTSITLIERLYHILHEVSRD